MFFDTDDELSARAFLEEVDKQLTLDTSGSRQCSCIQERIRSFNLGWCRDPLSKRFEILRSWSKCLLYWDEIAFGSNNMTNGPEPGEIGDNTFGFTENGDLSIVNRFDKRYKELGRQLKVDIARLKIYGNMSSDENKWRFDYVYKLGLLVFGLASGAQWSESWRNEEVMECELEYLQGGHDICGVFAKLNKPDILSEEVFPIEELAIIVRRFIVHRSFVLHTSLDLGTSMNYMSHVTTEILCLARQVNVLKSLEISLSVQKCGEGKAYGLRRNDISSRFQLDFALVGNEYHFMLPWIVTVLSHNIDDFNLIVRFWCWIISTPAPFFMYFIAVVVSRSVPTGTEFGPSERLQRNNPDKLQFTESFISKCIYDAYSMAKTVPYRNVIDKINRKYILLDGGAVETFEDCQEATMFCKSQNGIIPKHSIPPNLFSNGLDPDAGFVRHSNGISFLYASIFMERWSNSR